MVEENGFTLRARRSRKSFRACSLEVDRIALVVVNLLLPLLLAGEDSNGFEGTREMPMSEPRFGFRRQREEGGGEFGIQRLEYISLSSSLLSSVNGQKRRSLMLLQRGEQTDIR